MRQLPGRIAEPPWIISLHYAPEPASHSTVMPYVNGGVAFGGFRFAQTAGLNQSWSDMVHIGWTVGAGVEYAFTDHLIGGVEYNYYGFPGDTLSGGKNPTTIKVDQSMSTVVAKASYKF